MPKDTFYFSHDYNARNDERILELRSEFGAEGYGIFWMVIETMAENSNGGVMASLIGGLSFGYGVAKGRLLEVFGLCISLGLFYEDAGYYYSRRLLTHKDKRKNMVNYGQKGAKKRWGGYREANGGANGDANAKERKEKERKENNKEIVGDFGLLEINKEFINTGIAPDMYNIFFKYFPSYHHDKEKDFSACLQIAYKIADSKKWDRSSVLKENKKEVLELWDKVALFTTTDKWFSKRALYDLNNEWQRLVQSMNGTFSGIHGKINELKEYQRPIADNAMAEKYKKKINDNTRV